MDRAVNRDAAIIGIVRSSALAGVAAGVIAAFEQAARGSFTRSICAPFAAAWRTFDRSQRLRSIGMVLVTAVIVHAALMLLRPLPGWRAFVVPAIALVQGLLLIVMSAPPRSNR
jgi:hypothetical protein